jgi:hypothetical protein
VNEEKARLIDAMQQHLRLKAAYGQAMTVGELSAQIKELTGQSWGAYWEGRYGNLMVFLKNNPDAFSVIKNKYVTCRGQEDVAMRQIDREAQEQSLMLEQQQRAQMQYSSVPIGVPPLQTHATSFYAPNFEDPFGLGQPSSYAPQQPSTLDYSTTQDPWAANTVPSRSNSLASRRDSNEWALPNVQNNSFDPFAPIDPFRSGEAPSYIPHAQNTSSADWWGTSSQLPPRPPLDAFNMSNLNQSLPLQNTSTASGLSAEEEEAIKKAERKAARKQKKQEEEDERLARELQNQEFQNSGTRAASSNGFEDTGETIVLTTSQMRDLAEKELGIDNVRIIAGFTVKKYGREGRPHQRKMWVTQSLTHLAWASSLLEGSHRGIELKHVTEVTSGQMTPTIARTTSDKKKVQAQCFSLVTMSRTLDMQACSVIQRDALVNALKSVVAFNHKYKPEKVDRDLTRIRLLDNALMFRDKRN